VPSTKTEEAKMAEWQEPAPGATTEPPAGGDNWAGDLEAMSQFAEGGIVSKTIVDRPNVTNISLFMMSTGQTMSSHKASRPATIHVLGGEGKITIGDQTWNSKRGSFFYMPAGQPHALESTDNMVFLLHLIG
jgi:quercetin dioxygenase-like cupin family protein